MSEDEQDRPDDDGVIARLLRASGGREQPSEDLQRDVRAAVHAEWRTLVAARTRTRQRIWLAAAASLIAVVAGLWVVQTRLTTPGVSLASVNRLEGNVNSQEHSPLSWLTGNRWQAVGLHQQMHAGESLQTGRDGRAALTVAGNVSLRLDHDTRIAFVAADRIEVQSGAVYVDAGTAPSRETLLLDTPAGAVRHLGTQYEVRMLSAGTRIRVREGRVELSDASGSTEQLSAGEQLIVAADGTHRRGVAEAQDADWSWSAQVAPPFEIEGRLLSEFLGWVSRETGRRLVFADPASEAEALSAVLHGSVAGLAPGEALRAVLPTTRLQGRIINGDLLIETP